MFVCREIDPSEKRQKASETKVYVNKFLYKMFVIPKNKITNTFVLILGTKLSLAHEWLR